MADAPLPPEARDLILAMPSHRDELIPYVRQTAANAQLPVARVRDLLKILADRRLATFGPLYHPDDGRPLGSSWWLTESGLALQQQLENANV